MLSKPSTSPSGAIPPSMRPRLSPTTAGNLGGGGEYFIPPTPGVAHGPPGWSPFVPTDTDENHGRGSFDARFQGGGGGNDAGGAGGAFFGGGDTGGAAGGASAWGGASLPPSFALSPSSTAFNAKFNHLLRGPSSSASAASSSTPLHPPPSSPFFPTDSSASASSTTPAAPPSSSPFAPPPSTMNFFNFPASASSGGFKLPSTLPMGGRKLAGRPAARPSPTPSSTSNARYTLYNPQTIFSQLLSSLSSSSTSSPLLILDIRSHTAFLTERISSSINICVPSTLLRRPGFGVDRVLESLPPTDQAVFEGWASCAAVIVLDAESTSLAEGGGVGSLLAKFDKAGFQGKLGWVKGGWYAVRTQLRALSASEAAKLVQTGAQTSEVAGSRSDTPTDANGRDPALSTPHGSASKKHGRPVLQVRNLPAAAFQLASTSAFVNSGVPGVDTDGTPLPTSRRGMDLHITEPSTSAGSSTSSASQRPGMGKRRKSGNENGLGGAMPTLLGMGGFAGNGNQQGGTVGSQQRMSTNPFFDNIRQNSEALSLERSLANLNPVDLPSVPAALFPFLPPFIQSLIRLSPMDRANRLARQFYELEAGERERLEGMFRWHSQQSQPAAKAPELQNFVAGSAQKSGTKTKEAEEGTQWEKFGISAGVELGALNRFKNIFPYEHARVKLSLHSPSATDYINASHLFLRDSSKRFIASQGPLPTTFRDFWQLCDQERIGVIIMLTNLNEGGREKCGRYWVTQQNGEWDVDVEGDLAHREEEDLNCGAGGMGGPSLGVSGGPGGGFFASFDGGNNDEKEKKVPETPQDSTIRRNITVRRLNAPADHPSSRPRKIRHIQYRAWPDFDIPAAPAEVVALVHEVDAAQQAYIREIGWNPEEHDGLEPPVLAHCSAGVGRTGVFIMVSSLLEKLRKDREADRRKKQDSMDVDSTPLSRPSLEARVSDPETSFLSAGLSLSSLNSSPSKLPSSQPSSSTTPTPSSSSTTPGASTPTPSSSSSSAATSTASTGYSFEDTHQPLPSLATSALSQDDPMFAGVNELREQRMSMVANYRQYVCVVECVIEGAVSEMKDEGVAA